MRAVADIASELRSRRCCIRQYLGEIKFEVWMDGRCRATVTEPEEAESIVRRLLNITPEEGAMLDAYLEQLARNETPPEAN